MSKKSEARRKACELKKKGFPFILRHKFARKLVKAHLSGDEILKLLGAKLKSWHGCECCDPGIYKQWEYKSYLIDTEWGAFDHCVKRKEPAS